MAVKIMIPTPLRPYTGQQAVVEIDGKNVGEILQNLTARHADLKAHLFAPDGKLRSFVNVYLNDEDIRYLRREETPVTSSDTLSIVPSVAGGSGARRGPVPAVAEALIAGAALPQLTNDEISRYSRHLIMPEVG